MSFKWKNNYFCIRRKREKHEIFYLSHIIIYEFEVQLRQKNGNEKRSLNGIHSLVVIENKKMRSDWKMYEQNIVNIDVTQRRRRKIYDENGRNERIKKPIDNRSLKSAIDNANNETKSSKRENEIKMNRKNRIWRALRLNCESSTKCIFSNRRQHKTAEYTITNTK